MNHKTILVTGASRGIGKAIALTYARNGWDVVITCLRREEELKKTQREIEALGVSWAMRAILRAVPACLTRSGSASVPWMSSSTMQGFPTSVCSRI